MTKAPATTSPSRGPRIPLYRTVVAALSMWCFLLGPWQGTGRRHGRREGSTTPPPSEARSPCAARAGAGLGGAAQGAEGGEGRKVEVEQDVRRARRSGLSWVTLPVVAVVMVAAVAQAWPLVAVGWLVLAARQVRAVRASYRNEPAD